MYFTSALLTSTMSQGLIVSQRTAYPTLHAGLLLTLGLTLQPFRHKCPTLWTAINPQRFSFV